MPPITHCHSLANWYRTCWIATRALCVCRSQSRKKRLADALSIGYPLKWPLYRPSSNRQLISRRPRANCSCGHYCSVGLRWHGSFGKWCPIQLVRFNRIHSISSPGPYRLGIGRLQAAHVVAIENAPTKRSAIGRQVWNGKNVRLRRL